MQKMILVGGKGGTGKSLLTLCLLDILLSTGKKPLYVETVKDICDVYKTVHSCVATVLADPASQSGLALISDGLVSENPDYVVVNTSVPLGDFIHYAHALSGFASLQGMQFTVAWIINLHMDSLEMLHAVIESGVAAEDVCVVRNLFFGSESYFGQYNVSNLSRRVKQSLNMPVFSKCLSGLLNFERIPLWVESDRLPIIQRSCLFRFRDDARKSLSALLD